MKSIQTTTKMIDKVFVCYLLVSHVNISTTETSSSSNTDTSEFTTSVETDSSSSVTSQAPTSSSVTPQAPTSSSVTPQAPTSSQTSSVLAVTYTVYEAILIQNVTLKSSTLSYSNDNDVLPIIIGCTVGGAILICILFVFVVILVKKFQIMKRNSKQRRNIINDINHLNSFKSQSVFEMDKFENTKYNNVQILKTDIFKIDDANGDLHFEISEVANAHSNRQSSKKVTNPNILANNYNVNTSLMEDNCTAYVNCQSVDSNHVSDDCGLDEVETEETNDAYSRLGEPFRKFQNIYNESPVHSATDGDHPTLDFYSVPSKLSRVIDKKSVENNLGNSGMRHVQDETPVDD